MNDPNDGYCNQRHYDTNATPQDDALLLRKLELASLVQLATFITRIASACRILPWTPPNPPLLITKI
jgi:hypothetical protein